MYTGVVLTWGRLPCCAGVTLCVLPTAAESSVGGADPPSETAHRCQTATWCSHCSGCPNAPFTDTQTHWKTLMINTLVPYSSINATREVINYSQCALLLLSNHFFFTHLGWHHLSATCRLGRGHWRSSPCACGAAGNDLPSRTSLSWPSHSSLCEGSPQSAAPVHPHPSF